MEPEIDSSSCSGSLQEPWPAGGGRTPAVCDVVVGVAEPYAPRQFDRSSSFTGLTHSSIEMAGAGADCGSSSSSDDALPDAPPGPVQHCHPGTSMADAAAGAEQGSGGSSSGWAVFEVDEPSTETTFIMRGLREALAKKVRVAGQHPVAGGAGMPSGQGGAQRQRQRLLGCRCCRSSPPAGQQAARGAPGARAAGFRRSRALRVPEPHGAGASGCPPFIPPMASAPRPPQTDECEHLRQIIKELSESRARAHKGKVALEESHAALQKEYMR
jgi:hypothetical protein